MLVLLCGYKRCGKDTVASYLSQNYNFNHLKISYLLKKTLKVLFNFTDEQLEGNLKESIDDNWKITPRDAMKFIGTDIFQFNIQKLIPEIGRNFWIKGLCEKINNDFKDNNNKIAISDLRFIHELDYIYNNIHTHDIIIVKIMRDGLIIQENVTDITENEHLKFKFDHIIVNTNDMKCFENTIDILMNNIN